MVAKLVAVTSARPPDLHLFVLGPGGFREAPEAHGGPSGTPRGLPEPPAPGPKT